MFGDAATPENEFGYAWMPKLEDGKTYSWLDLFDAMYKGEIKGFFSWGQNPACSGANSNKTRQALAKLDWMVTVNLFDNETASFWKGPGMDPEEDQDRSLLPALRGLHGKGGIDLQQRPLGAVALQGPESPGRGPPGRRHHGGSLQRNP